MSETNTSQETHAIVKRALVYVWDVWLIYGPRAEWTDVGPPVPLHLMHQLPQVQNPSFIYLDSKAFAQQVRMLAGLPLAK